MNADNFQQPQQQPLFKEPAFIDGTAGKKQIPGEPQFISGKATENLNPLYADQTRPDPYHPRPGLGGEKSLPLYGGENKAPIYADQVSSMNKLYPGQENFLAQQMKFVDGKEVLTTGGVVQAAYVPPTHGEHKTEYVHLTPSEHLQLKPDTEHIHIKADPNPPPNVEQVIRIKPDGQIQVTAEKLGEHHNTEHLKKEHEPVEKEHIKTKKVSKKKKHVEEKVKHDIPTETTTVVKVTEHDGTGGYDKEGKLGKHDDKHHHGTDDKHHHGTDDKHHGTDDTHHHGIFGKKEHVDTHHHGTGDTHHHGTDETKVIVNKTHGSPDNVHVTTEEHATTEHLKAGKTEKKKRLSGKKHKGDKSKHHHGTDKPHRGKEILE